MSMIMNPFAPSSTLRSGAAHDVIIVGARAAGAATAMLLARRGLRALLLERAAFGSDTLSTHALMRGGVLQLSRWNLLDRVVAAGTPAVRRTTFQFADQQIVVDIKPSHGVDALYAPRRTVLDPLLVEAAVEAGADVHFGTSVTGLMWRGRSVVGVRAVTADGRTVELRAPLVIGADGVRSAIARHVRAKSTRVGHHIGAATTYGYWSDLDIDGYRWLFRSDAVSGLIPTNDGQVCVFANGVPDQIGRGGVELIVDTVAAGDPELAQRLREATPPRGTRSWMGHRAYLRNAHGPGWALVGDAGYHKDPISAHGITDALRDAELLARAVFEGMASSALAESLSHYELTRDRISIPLFDIVDRIAGHEWADDEIGALLLRLSAAMNDEIETIAGLEHGTVVQA
jgi:flavin-dependent dehydrogenase